MLTRRLFLGAAAAAPAAFTGAAQALELPPEPELLKPPPIVPAAPGYPAVYVYDPDGRYTFVGYVTSLERRYDYFDVSTFGDPHGRRFIPHPAGDRITIEAAPIEVRLG